MQNFDYVLRNFFTHKDFLVSPDQIPGTLFTPLSFLFEAVVLFIIISGAIYVSRRKQLIRPVFTAVWLTMLLWEPVIIAWDNLAGAPAPFDWVTSLSLYPCSIFLYTMPFIIWGKGKPAKMACGYLCTLGLLGALVNFLVPFTRLASYSCLSFPAFHTFAFHGSMLFCCLVLQLSGEHRYTHARCWQELFYPCVPSLIVSIPANILNYSALNSDYMYFKGHFPLLARIFGATPEIYITLFLYLLYICIPALFYLPAYLWSRRDETPRQYIPRLRGLLFGE